MQNGIVSAYDLLTTAYPDPVWAIPSHLPVGLTIFGAVPKAGKSWMALQIAQAVATGGMVFGQKIQKGPVLYLALEDSRRRLQDRMKAQNWPVDPTIQCDFLTLADFMSQFGPLHLGGFTVLEQWIASQCYRLVVIDTLSRAFTGIQDIDKNQQVTKALGPIQEMSNVNNCATFILDHHNKAAAGGDPNPINNILGSVAKGAVLDTAWGLYREKGKAGAKLIITGRDVEEHTLNLNWDVMLKCWQDTSSPNNSSPFSISPLQQKILDLLRTVGASIFMDIVKIGAFDKGNCFKALQDMRNLGIVNFDVNTHEYYI